MSKISFYREKNFKKTEIGEIPREWEVRRLGDKEFFKITMGQSPPSKSYNQKGKGVPFLQGSAEFGFLYPKTNKFTTQPYKLAVKNSILLSVRAPVGDINIADKEYCIGRGLSAIKPINVNLFYLFYILHFLKPKIEQLGGGSTFKAISKKQIEDFKIPLPPLEEQIAIAKVLKDFDDLLENIEKQIKILERIKKGLMNIYFTKGVFKHKTFKDTEIGRIPEGWEVKEVKEILKIAKSVNGLRENEIMKEGKYPVINQGKDYVLGFSDKEEFLIKENLPLIIFGDHTCEVKYVDFPFIVAGEGVKILKPHEDINPLFFFYAVSKYKPKPEHYRRHFKLLKQSKIPLPPLEEQKAIAERLKTIDNQIENLKKQKEHLQKVKKKFMDLLLTGKIRVKIHS